MTNTLSVQRQAPAQLPLSTGSGVLDQLLAQGGVTAGRVMHLCGGSPVLQQRMLLNLCHAAVESGERALYFDIEQRLQPQSIERAGLLPVFNPSDPGDEDARFRVQSPQTPKEVDKQLKALTQLAPVPAVVVVNGLERALENRFGGAKMRGENLARAGRTLCNLIQKHRVLCERAGTTLVLTHSPAKRRGDSLTELEKTVRGTMFKHGDFGLSLRPVWTQNAQDDFLRVAVQAWRYNTTVGEEALLELWKEGGFKN